MKLISINDFIYNISNKDFYLMEKCADSENFPEFLCQLQKDYKALYRLDYQVRYD